jgi:CSLREA domain-containing protein
MHPLLRGAAPALVRGAGSRCRLTALALALLGAQAACYARPTGRPFAVMSSFIRLQVNSNVDAVDAVPGDGRCETAPDADGRRRCTLRAAIQESNAYGFKPPPLPPNTVTIWLPNEITLPAGTYQLTIPQPSSGDITGGDLNITHSVTIRAAGASSTFIDGNLQFRVFLISGGMVDISRVTIRNGKGGTSLPGAGVLVRSSAALRLSDCAVINNETDAPGGGISNGGVLRITRCAVRNNKVPLTGGGGTQYSGGGIMNYSGALATIDQSTISGNQATRGGGIRNAGGRLEITNSTVSGNVASKRGGGIMNSGSANIAFTTITDNKANTMPGGSEPSVGGGIFHEGAVADGVVSIGNSILAKNTDNRSRFDAQFAPDCYTSPGSTAEITSFRGNLIGILSPTTCKLGGGIQLDQLGSPATPLDPGLDALGSNGGLTQTHALLTSPAPSPAIDRANVTSGAPFFDCPAIDQRDFVRPTGSACDAGAYELK